MMRALATLRNSGALIVLVVTYAVFSVAAPSFFGLRNLLDIIHVISPMIIVATGMALVVMSGKLDISVGSTFASVVLFTREYGFPLSSDTVNVAPDDETVPTMMEFPACVPSGNGHL